MSTGPWKKQAKVSDPEPALAPLLRMVPELIRQGILTISRSGLYRVTFPTGGHLMRAAGGSGFRALVVNGKNQVLGHGVLSHASLPPNALIVWQVLAIVTAQHYLEKISSDLKHLHHGVEWIQKWLSNERVASLQANASTLAEIELGLASDRGFLARSVLHQSALADVDRDCSKIARACLLDLQGIDEDVKAVELSALWSSDGRPLIDLLPKVCTAIDAVAFALTMRIYNTGLLSSLLGDLNISRFRSDDTNTIYADTQKALERVLLQVDNRISSLNERLSWPTTVEAKKVSLRQTVARELLQSKERLKAVAQAMASYNRSVSDLACMLSRPLTVEVQLIDGQVLCRM